MAPAIRHGDMFKSIRKDSLVRCVLRDGVPFHFMSLDGEEDAYDVTPLAYDVLRGSGTSPAAVVLQGKGKPCIVLGVKKRKLTTPQCDVIDALLRHPGGLSKDSLVCESGRKGAVDILKRLCKRDEDWESVISLAGTTGGGYRIVDPR